MPVVEHWMPINNLSDNYLIIQTKLNNFYIYIYIYIFIRNNNNDWKYCCTHKKKKGQFSSEFLLNNTSSYFETKGKKPKPIKKFIDMVKSFYYFRNI